MDAGPKPPARLESYRIVYENGNLLRVPAAGTEPCAAGMGVAALVALGCVAAPIFIVDADGALAHANGAGSEVLRAGKAIRQVKGRISFRRAGDAHSFAAALACVIETGTVKVLRLRTRADDLNYILTLAPVSAQPLVVVCVADLRSAAPPAPGWTMRVFAFSPQSAALAESLANGGSLADFAAASGVTLGGVRTRLKKLLTATNTRSQAALVGVLLRAAAIRPMPAG